MEINSKARENTRKIRRRSEGGTISWEMVMIPSLSGIMNLAMWLLADYTEQPYSPSPRA